MVYTGRAQSQISNLNTDYFITLNASYTLTSQTAAQKLFNASPAGALLLPSGTYLFECDFNLSALSATSGAFGFALGGTLASQSWKSIANKAALATAVAPQATANTAANAAICTATANTVGWARITGKFRVSVAGLVVPQVSLGVAAAAVVGADSYFRARRVADVGDTKIGPWT